jgi:hypothetical protein
VGVGPTLGEKLVPPGDGGILGNEDGCQLGSINGERLGTWLGPAEVVGVRPSLGDELDSLVDGVRLGDKDGSQLGLFDSAMLGSSEVGLRLGWAKLGNGDGLGGSKEGFADDGEPLGIVVGPREPVGDGKVGPAVDVVISGMSVGLCEGPLLGIVLGPVRRCVRVGRRLPLGWDVGKELSAKDEPS